MDLGSHGSMAGPLRKAVTAVLACGVLLAGPVCPSAADGREVGGDGSRYYLNDSWSANANHELAYGRFDDRVYVGDWDGDTKTTLMVRRGNQYHVRNSVTTGPASAVIGYGNAGDTVLVGDWNGDGKDTLTVRRGNVYHFRNSLTSGPATKAVSYGRADDVILVGDWDGDGTDTLAVRRGNQYLVKNSITSGAADQVVHYGRNDDVVLVGDWDGNGTDTFAVRRGMTYYVANVIRTGNADRTQNYGRETDTVLAGDWNGDSKDTLGVRRMTDADRRALAGPLPECGDQPPQPRSPNWSLRHLNPGQWDQRYASWQAEMREWESTFRAWTDCQGRLTEWERIIYGVQPQTPMTPAQCENLTPADPWVAMCKSMLDWQPVRPAAPYRPCPSGTRWIETISCEPCTFWWVCR